MDTQWEMPRHEISNFLHEGKCKAVLTKATKNILTLRISGINKKNVEYVETLRRLLYESFMEDRFITLFDETIGGGRTLFGLLIGFKCHRDSDNKCSYVIKLKRVRRLRRINKL